MRRNFLIFLILASNLAWAERRDVVIEDRSSSGKTLRINIGQADGLRMRDAVLIRDEQEKILAARVISLMPQQAVVYTVESYRAETPERGQKYNALFGIPLGNIPDLPDNLSDTDVPDNPQDERFFTADGEEITTPDLDDQNYEPETELRPNFPDKKRRMTHNLSIGVGLFRNANLSRSNAAASAPTNSRSLYQGYALRYQYNFRTSYWSRRKVPVWIGTELGVGTYSFTETFSETSRARINVIPLSVNIKYIWELSPFFRAYPYVGVQNNLVSATPLTTRTSNSDIDDLRGSSIVIGGGFALVMSESMDVRADFGVDGGLLAAIVKF